MESLQAWRNYIKGAVQIWYIAMWRSATFSSLPNTMGNWQTSDCEGSSVSSQMSVTFSGQNWWTGAVLRHVLIVQVLASLEQGNTKDILRSKRPIQIMNSYGKLPSLRCLVWSPKRETHANNQQSGAWAVALEASVSNDSLDES